MKRIIYGLLSILLIIINIPLYIKADDNSSSETIKVGFYSLYGFQNKESDGTFSGYAYDYYMEIAQHTGWKYEFVYDFYENCCEKLNDGDIDVMCTISDNGYLNESIEYYNESIYNTYYYLYVMPDSDVCYEEYQRFDNMVIGTLKNNDWKNVLDEYSDSHSINVKVVEYDRYSQLQDALKYGSVDAIYTTGLKIKDYKIVDSFNPVKLYFAADKSSGLIEKISTAIKSIKESDRYYETELLKKYVKETSASIPCFTRAEQNYIDNADTIRVVYDPEWQPIEYTDDDSGEYKGISAELFNKITELTDLKFEFYSADSFAEAVDEMEDNHIQMMTAISRDYVWAESLNMNLSNAYLDSDVVLITRTTTEINEDGIIALPKGYYTSTVIEKNFPNADIVYYDTIKDCFDAVRKSEADSTFANSYVANYFLSKMQYQNLCQTEIAEYKENLAIAISKDEPVELLTIINKALNCISDDDINNYIILNSADTEQMSIKDIVYAYPQKAFTVVIIVTVLIVAMLIIILIIRNRATIMMRRLAQHDSLTGLYNRSYIENHISQCMLMERTNTLALIIMDIDDFKNVNDTYGHPAGDRLLVNVAGVIKDYGTAGRMGGDEFLMFFTDSASVNDIENIASDLGRKLHTLSADNGVSGCISASMGIAVYPEDGIDFETLYRHADEALYIAKKEKNKAVKYKNRSAGN